MSKETLADKVERLRKDNRRKRDLIRKLRKQIQTMEWVSGEVGIQQESQGDVANPLMDAVYKSNRDLYAENVILTENNKALRGMVELYLRESKSRE